jgi:hypothetical protein
VAFREDRSLPTCRDTLLHVVMDLFLNKESLDLYSISVAYKKRPTYTRTHARTQQAAHAHVLACHRIKKCLGLFYIFVNL